MEGSCHVEYEECEHEECERSIRSVNKVRRIVAKEGLNRWMPKGLKKGSAACRWMEHVDVAIDTEVEDEVNVGSMPMEMKSK